MDCLLKVGQGGESKFCTIPLVGVFCLGGILTSRVMVGHAFTAWTNLFIIINLVYTVRNLICLDKLGNDIFMHLALRSIKNMLLQSHEGKFYYKANYLLNSNFSEMQTKLEDDCLTAIFQTTTKSLCLQPSVNIIKFV